MFKKLVSNLPFSPTLLGQVSFYLSRLHREEAIRKLGFILILLVLLVQIFAIMFPSKPSLATSASDIVYGATSKQDVLKAYNQNKDQAGRKDIKAIFDYYGIGKEQIQNAKLTTIKDNDGHDYINTSRSPTQYPDTFVKIPSVSDGGIYEFPLEYWRKGQYPNGYPAIEGTSAYGFKFWILLKGCGNIVIEKGSKQPNLDITKQRISSSTASVGETISYKIEFRNHGLANAKNVSITDKLSDEFSYVNYTSNLDLKFSQQGQSLTWKINSKDGALGSSSRWYTINVNVKAKDIAPNTKQVCNASTIDAGNSKPASSDGNNPISCVNIIKLVCPGTGLPIPPGGISECIATCPDGSQIPYNQSCIVPQLTCQSLKVVGTPSWNTRKYQTTILMQKGGAAKQINYFVNDKKVGVQAMSSGSDSQIFDYTFPSAGVYNVRAELEASTGSVQPSQSCELKETITQPVNPVARISTDKNVSNMTQGIKDANGTTAHASDVLKYTLTIENSGDAPAVNLNLDGEYGENIADILEYADLTDKNDATFNSSTDVLSWPAVTIPAGSKIEKTFTVTVKNPIPATPTSISNPLSYDYTMHNVYGRDVYIKLDKPASKVVEQTATSLPNTGPGTAMFVSAILVTIIGYFLYRTRLLAKELDIVKNDYSTGGM